MHVHVQAQLLAPPKQLYKVGGTNPPLATFSGVEEIELNPALLEELVSDRPAAFDIRGVTLYTDQNCYSAKSNILSLQGHLKSFDRECLEELIRNGWDIDYEALKHYHIHLIVA